MSLIKNWPSPNPITYVAAINYDVKTTEKSHRMANIEDVIIHGIKLPCAIEK